VTYFTLRLIGYDDVSLFTGSWAEWILDPNRPVTTGDEP
jgi:thiosulfate/3-mercaptopyruvate sulfurtransferase